MASIRPYPYRKGWWRAQVRRRGIVDSEIFDSKQKASAWAFRREAEIIDGERGGIPNLTLGDLFSRYAKEVSPAKKGAKWEKVRLDLLGRDRIAQVRLRDLSAAHLSDWQKRRLEAVSEASVRRERNLLNNALEIARREWGWIKSNPFERIRRPKDGTPKERVADPGEIQRILDHASPQMARVVGWALETGMRASEIASLTEITGNVAILRDTKNGTRREVPLSAAALAAWKDGGFGLTAGSISSLFARYAKEAKVEGLTFHCLRRTAATRLSQKLTVFELCDFFGWKDPRIALKYYYKNQLEIVLKKLSE